jgi:hypothetical protein
MKVRKFLIPMVCGLAFGLSACGGDSTAANEGDNPFGGGQGLSSDGTAVLPGSSTSTPVTPGTTAPLAATADLNAPAALYAAWKSYHFVTLDEEAAYYPSLAGDFKYVFPAEYQPAARVIWQTAQSSAYNLRCKVDDSTVPIMKFRGCTVSEGIGYGMLITAMQGDIAAFNGLWNYSRAFRKYYSTATVPQRFTPWITFSFYYDEIDLSSATDADLDIATSLILMHLKTGEQAYLADALTIAGAIWEKEVKDNKLLSGDTPMWNGTQGQIVYNLSYFSPVALRLFAKFDTAHNWTAVLDAMYTYMASIQAAGTGVFPDWSTETTAANPPNGAAGDEKKGYTFHTFNKESVRIPWRIAWDYYWFQDPRALAVLQKLNQFIVAKSGGSPSSAALAVNYSWNLSLGADDTRNSAVSAQWLSAWCATGIGTNADWLKACTSAVNTKSVSNTASSYFSDILLVMYSQLLNGMYTRPAI